MASAKQVMEQNSPKKGSVRFDAKSSDKHPLAMSIYIMRDAAKKYLGIKDLDKVEEIEITVRAVGKQSEEEDD